MEEKNKKIKKINKLELVATAQEMEDKETKQKISFIKYEIVLDGTRIGIGANDKFKELLKYLVGASDLELNQSVVVGDK